MLVRFDNYKDTILQDDDTPYGSVSFTGETLEDFLLETINENIPEYIDLEKINIELKNCGILPIRKEF